ncbi:hypothetical protein BHE74_00052656, partial [Ensete ventricosum]
DVRPIERTTQRRVKEEEDSSEFAPHRIDLDDLHGMPKMSGGKAPSTHVAAPAWEGKEPAALSEEPETPAESDEGGASPIHHRPRSMKDLFKRKVRKDDAGYYTLQMSDLGHQDPDKKMKARWRGLKNSTKVWNDSWPPRSSRGDFSTLSWRGSYTRSPRRRSSGSRPLKKKLSEVRSNLAEIQRLLKEARVRARKMDDKLLQVMKALENARAELPRQAVDRYMESTDFKEGLKRMSRVIYE